MISRRKKSGNVWKRIVLVLFASALAAELVLQLVMTRPLWQAGGNIAQYVPYVGYVARSKEDSLDAPLPGFVSTFGASGEGELVWLFGGSTMQGGYSSVPDLPCEPERPCTIASWLAEELEDRGNPHRVWNLGQIGYRSHQERILFVELLARMETPSIAIFYDGVNELRNGSGIAGYPFHYQMYRDEIEWNRSRARFSNGLRRARFKLAYLLHYVANSRAWPEPILPFGNWLVEGEEKRHEKVADEVLSYVHNVRTLKAVCDEFSVRCLFVWQPFLCDKETRSDLEEEIAESECSDRYGLAVHHEVAETLQRDPHFLDLRFVFQDTTENVFLDAISHIDEAGQGNRRIARAIAARLFPLHGESL